MLRRWLAGWSMLLLANVSGAASDILGYPLDTPIDPAMTGASRDGAPAGLQLQHSALLPAGAAATQQWQAVSHWWYATPKAIPARFAPRAHTLQIAIDQQGALFWVQLAVASKDCAADQQWLEKALAARYLVGNLPDPTADAAVARAPVYQTEDRAVLVTANCAAAQLVLEYLLPGRYQNAYERQSRAVSAANTASELAADDVRAQALADQSQALLRGNRDVLHSWLGIALGQDGVTDQAPGQMHPFDPTQTVFGHLAKHALLAGASHTLEADALGGITRITTELPDPDASLQQRWQRLLRTRFGRPAKDTDKHQIHRFGAQRLVLRRDRGVLRIAYQDLTRKKAERERLAAHRAAQYRESIQGL